MPWIIDISQPDVQIIYVPDVSDSPLDTPHTSSSDCWCGPTESVFPGTDRSMWTHQQDTDDPLPVIEAAPPSPPSALPPSTTST